MGFRILGDVIGMKPRWIGGQEITPPFFTKCKVAWNPTKLISTFDRANSTALGRAGALIYTIARHIIRKRAEGIYSKPGQPPFSHQSFAFKMYNYPLRESIAFNVDEKRPNCIIGPVFHVMHELANLHEFGGTTVSGKRSGYKLRRYPPRPFMKPSLERAMPKISVQWRNVLVSGV